MGYSKDANKLAGVRTDENFPESDHDRLLLLLKTSPSGPARPGSTTASWDFILLPSANWGEIGMAAMKRNAAAVRVEVLAALMV